VDYIVATVLNSRMENVPDAKLIVRPRGVKPVPAVWKIVILPVLIVIPPPLQIVKSSVISYPTFFLLSLNPTVQPQSNTSVNMAVKPTSG
jgi:hypothetical protein